MNCIDFRRVILANPRQPGGPQMVHAAECPACREYLEKQRQLDAELFEALQVPPPDGLAERIIVSRGLRARRWVMPMAAALVLAAGLGVLWPRLSPGDSLGREAIAHVKHEPQAFTAAYAHPTDLLGSLLAQQGVALARNVGQVTYSVACPMVGRVARHLVVRTAEGPITMLLVPDDPHARVRAVTERDGMAAITLPAGRGSIAIVAKTLGEALAMENSLRRG